MTIPLWLLDAYRRRRDRRIMNLRQPDVIRRYQRRYRVHTQAARLVNSLLQVFVRPTPPREIPPPQRILLANLGGLGDVVLSTAAIGIVRKAFPQARLGILLGSWSRPVLSGHPHIHHFHMLNHWQVERTGEPLRVRMPRYLRAAARMAGELRGMGYDAAVDLRTWWPNAAYVLYRARIPVRIGHPCAGLGALLTHPRPFVYRRLHESRIQAELLRSLPIPPDMFVEEPPFDMPPGTEDARREVRALLLSAGLDGRAYRVMHMGASVPVRDWPLENWRRLATRLVEEGRALVFPGRGERDRKLIEPVIAGLANCVSACDRLGWAGLVEMIRGAELAYSVETMAGHIAVAVGTPCVGIYGGMSDSKVWAPRPGPTSVCVTHVVPCWPCFQFNGCGPMSCLRDLEVARVHEAGEQVAKSRTANRES